MKLKSNLALLAVSVLLALAAAEIGLRALGISFPEFNRLDPVLGWRPRPGVSGIYTREGGAFVSINAEGFRDVEHPVAKPPGTIRIAVIGDSMTEGREVALAETYWKRLEARLAACPARDGRRVEVLGFGVNGYGTAQELLVLRDHVLKYDPDLVLLAVFTANDIWNNSRALDGHPDRPYFRLEGGRLVAPDPAARDLAFRAKYWWIEIKHWVVNRLRTLQLLKEGYERARTLLARSRPAAILSPGPDAAVYRPPETAVWRDAWALTEALIAEMNRLVRARGAGFWLVTLSNPIQVHPDAALRRDYMAAAGVETLDYPDRRLADFGRRAGIPVVTLAGPMAEHVAREGVVLHGFPEAPGNGHWNREGHRLAAEILAERLCPALAGL